MPGQLDDGDEDGGDEEERQPLHHLPQVQVRPHPWLLHPPDLHSPHHHRHEFLGIFPSQKSPDRFSGLLMTDHNWYDHCCHFHHKNIIVSKSSVLIASHWVFIWLIETDVGHETAAIFFVIVIFIIFVIVVVIKISGVLLADQDRHGSWDSCQDWTWSHEHFGRCHHWLWWQN